jgi:hypothetical protein
MEKKETQMESKVVNTLSKEKVGVDVRTRKRR